MENTNTSCDLACQNDSPCAGWVYHQQNKTCNLFSKLNQLYEFHGTYFGIKNCTTQLFNQLITGKTEHLLFKKVFETKISMLGFSNNVTNSSTVMNSTGKQVIDMI